MKRSLLALQGAVLRCALAGATGVPVAVNQPVNYGLTPIEWQTTPEVDAGVSAIRDDPALRRKGEGTRLFVRTQLKYGLERDDYLHKWYDRPLLGNVRYQDICEPGHLINAEGWRRMADLARLCGHGYAAFTVTKGREDILSRSTLPGAECDVLVETVLDAGIGAEGLLKVEPALARIAEALQSTNTFRINGRLIVTGYPDVRVDRLEEYANLHDEIKRRWGDKVALMPYFTPFSKEGGRKFGLEELQKVRENLRAALRTVDGLCLSLSDMMDFNRRTNPRFAVEVMAPVICAVLAEPEFKGKPFGMLVACGHENCYRWNYAKDCTGTRLLRDYYQAVEAFRPDFVIAAEWDEENENTHHRPTVAQGFVTQRLMRYATAALNNRPQEVWPGDDTSVPNLVVSYRKALLAGEPIEVEVLNIPDGSFPNKEFVVQFKWKNAAGKVVKTYSPQSIPSGELLARWFASPVTELIAEPLLVPELTVWCDGQKRVYSDGLWPVSLHVNRSVEFRWVKQALREKTAGVKSSLLVSQPDSNGSVEVSGFVDSPETLRSVEVLDGPDTVYLHDPTASSRDDGDSELIRISWQGLPWNKTERPSGTIRLDGANSSRIMSAAEMGLGRFSRVGRMTQNVVQDGVVRFSGKQVDGQPGSVFARIARTDVKSAEFVVDMPPYFKTVLRAEDVLQKEIHSLPAAGGMNLVFRRWSTPVALLPPCGGKRAEFSFRIKPSSPDSVLRIQSIDERFHVDYGKCCSLFRPSGRTVKISAFERDLMTVGTSTVDVARVVVPDYTFSPSRGGVVDSGAGLGLDGILCGYTPLVSGYGGGESAYGNVLLELVKSPAQMRGWPRTVPEYEREDDGGWSLRFGDASFVSLPQQVVPEYAGFCMKLDVRPDETVRRQGLFTSGPAYFNLGIEKGHVFAELFLRNRYAESPRKAFVRLCGPEVKQEQWNRIVVQWDRRRFRIDVNGVKGSEYDVSGDLFYARHSALGVMPGKDTFFSGCMRGLRVLPLGDIDAYTYRSPFSHSIAMEIRRVADHGGGRVVIPSGEWRSGPLELSSNVELHLESDSRIVFPDDPFLYGNRLGVYEGVRVNRPTPLIGAFGATNVAVTGTGELFAETDFWMKNYKTVARPCFLQFVDCVRVRVEGVRIRNSPSWTMHFALTDDVFVRGVDSRATGRNNDGVDLDSVDGALIEDCTLDQGDDAICMKSGKNAEGRRRNRPTRNVIIRNCTVVNGHTLLGVGSELSGGIENVMLENCKVLGEVWRILLIKTNRARGGFVRNVTVRNVEAARAKCAILGIMSDYQASRPENVVDAPFLTTIEGVLVDTVRCGESWYAYDLQGDVDMPPKGVVMRDCTVESPSRGVGRSSNVMGFSLERVVADPGLFSVWCDDADCRYVCGQEARFLIMPWTNMSAKVTLDDCAGKTLFEGKVELVKGQPMVLPGVRDTPGRLRIGVTCGEHRKTLFASFAKRKL